MSGWEPLAFLIVIGIGIFLAIRRSARSLDILTQWAAQNGYKLVEHEYRSFFRGPLFFSSNCQWVYRITVRDASGASRFGWARCGDWFIGMLSEEIEIRWDE